MKSGCFRAIGAILLILWMPACNLQNTQAEIDTQPYFDLRGFMEQQVNFLQGAKVVKESEIQGVGKKVELTFGEKDWREELDVFFRADINTPALATAYGVKKEGDYTIYELLPHSKGKVNEMRVKYSAGNVSEIIVKFSEKNLFYTSHTVASYIMKDTPDQLDHYSIESQQKIWLMEPNRMLIKGMIQ